jgi:hypothetical protein
VTYGLRIRDAAGNLRLDTADRVGRIVHREVLTRGASGTISLSGWDDTNTILFVSRLSGTGAGFVDESTGAHLAEWSSPGTVSYAPSPSGASLYAPSLLLVIALGDT